MECKRTWTRFVSILLIVALGVSFYAGLRACKADMLETSDRYYNQTNFMDLIIAGTYGMTESDIKAMQQLKTMEAVEGAYVKEVFVQQKEENLAVKAYSMTEEVNQFYLIDGRSPVSNLECMVDSLFLKNTGYQIGDQIQLALETQDLHESFVELNLTIVGSCYDARYLSLFRGNGDIGNGNVNSFIVLPKSNFKSDVYQEAYALVQGAKDFSSYENAYDNLIQEAKEEIQTITDAQCDARYEEITKEPREKLNAGLQAYETASQTLKKQKEEAFAQFEGEEAKLLLQKEQIATLEAELKDKKDKLTDISYGTEDIEIVLKPYQQQLELIKSAYETAKLALDSQKQGTIQQFEVAEDELATTKETLDRSKTELDQVEQPKWLIGDRNWIESYVSYQSDADRIDAIAKVFPAIFFFVAALVCLTTMTRMVDEQRTQIGILKALGYGKMSIAGKFMKYAFLATVIGSVLGVLIGQKVFPYVVIDAYRIMYAGLPYILTNYQPFYAILASGLAIVCTMVATFLACVVDLRSEPAQLMRPMAPKVGKRIWLERIPMVWKHINFTKKSTLRNLFRYKKRFLMTVIGIAGCMGLIIVGFGIKDSIGVMADLQYQDLMLQDAQISFDADLDLTHKKEYLTSLRNEENVTKVAMLYSKGVKVSHEEYNKSSTLYVLEGNEDFNQFFLFRDRELKIIHSITSDGVILTEKYASMLHVSVGDEILLDLGNNQIVPVSVSAISENYLGHYIFMTQELYEMLSGRLPEYNGGLLRTLNMTKTQEEQLFSKILTNEAILSIQSTRSLNERIDSMLESLNIITYVLIVSAGLLAFIVLYNLSNININERKRELASLKVLGFYDGEVNSYVMRETVILTVFGILVGVILGKVLHGFVIQTCEIDAVMFGRLIKLESYVISGVLTLMFSLFICFFMYFKLKKIDMIESLKSVE